MEAMVRLLISSALKNNILVSFYRFSLEYFAIVNGLLIWNFFKTYDAVKTGKVNMTAKRKGPTQLFTFLIFILLCFTIPTRLIFLSFNVFLVKRKLYRLITKRNCVSPTRQERAVFCQSGRNKG